MFGSLEVEVEADVKSWRADLPLNSKYVPWHVLGVQFYRPPPPQLKTPNGK